LVKWDGVREFGVDRDHVPILAIGLVFAMKTQLHKLEFSVEGVDCERVTTDISLRNSFLFGYSNFASRALSSASAPRRSSLVCSLCIGHDTIA
jgi:hypothetical protein